MKVNSQFKAEFIDKTDKKKLDTFLSVVFQKTSNKKIKVTFEVYEDGQISEKQYNLYVTIIRFICNETGNEFLTVEQEYMKLYKNSLFDVKKLSHPEFQLFLTFIEQKTMELFGFTFSLDEESKINLQ